MVPDMTNDPFGGFLQMSGMKVRFLIESNYSISNRLTFQKIEKR